LSVLEKLTMDRSNLMMS